NRRTLGPTPASTPPASTDPHVVVFSLTGAHHLEDVDDLLADRLRVDPVLRVALELHLPPAVRLGYRPAHRGRDVLGMLGPLAVFLVSGVTSTRCSASARALISATRSSIWPLVGFTITSGSTSPVGRTICSTTCLDFSSSYSPGVADMNTTWFTCSMNSLNRRGRLSSADGSRKPCSTSVSLRDRSPSYCPCSCGTVTCDSSSTQRKSSG